MSSFPGHVFSFKASTDEFMLMSYKAGKADDHITITDCGHKPPSASMDQSRWAEFEELAAESGSPCDGEDSSKWSCVRHLLPDEIKKRNPSEFGFHKEDLPPGRKVGQTADWSYGLSTMHKIINVTAYDGGYLKMQMTDGLKKIIMPWYEARKKDRMKVHEHIAGGYTNIHAIGMDKIDLDHFPQQHRGIIKEMQAVLEWWTKTRLRHTATFGARIYRRGSMLVNHVDRQDTHLAIAVLQVSQEVDEGGGWPLEIIHPHFPGVKEVYMQPGEMVLYEGARIHHGRPMRLKGNEFGNVFSHFSPMDWQGPHRTSTINPHYSPQKQATNHPKTEL